MQKDNKILLSAVLVLLISMFVNFGITGKVVDGSPDLIAKVEFVDKTTGKQITSPQLGQNADIKLTIINNGNGDAPAKATTKVVLKENGKKKIPDAKYTWNYKGSNKIEKNGGSFSVTLASFKFNAENTETCFDVKADKANLVPESDEDNNEVKNEFCVTVGTVKEEEASKAATTSKTKTKKKITKPTGEVYLKLQLLDPDNLYGSPIAEKKCLLSEKSDNVCTISDAPQLLPNREYRLRAQTTHSYWSANSVWIKKENVLLLKPKTCENKPICEFDIKQDQSGNTIIKNAQSVILEAKAKVAS